MGRKGGGRYGVATGLGAVGVFFVVWHFEGGGWELVEDG